MSLTSSTKFTTPPASKAESPPPPASPPPTHMYNKDRDALAFEHDRQRYKKALDRARNRARKAWASTSTHAAAGGQGHNPAVVHHHGAQEKGITVGDEDTDVDMVDAREVLPAKVVGGAAEAEPTKRGSRLEVKLADLVVLGRKGRGVDGDFEVIPHIRSVIVLDDHTYNGVNRARVDMQVDMDVFDLDEPWECVGDEFGAGVDGKSRKREVTYARVAALGAK